MPPEYNFDFWLEIEKMDELNFVQRLFLLQPSLADDTQTVAEHFLHKSMAHLLSQLDKPQERTYGMLRPISTDLLT